MSEMTMISVSWLWSSASRRSRSAPPITFTTTQRGATRQRPAWSPPPSTPRIQRRARTGSMGGP